MEQLLFIFLDGVGIGPTNPLINPFLHAEIPTWRAFVDGGWPTLEDPSRRSGSIATLLGADATLGVPGEPQSGTGTTALLTGENAPGRLARHAGPYPPAEIQPLLKEKNLLARAARRGKTIAFANAYPPFYLDRLVRGTARRTTCTQAALAAGLELRDRDALQRGEALSSWITNEHWHRVAPQIPAITPFKAGQNLARLAKQNDLTLYEYFHTDHAGHRPDLARAHRILQCLDQFLAGVVSCLDPKQDLLVLASDHGNFEEQNHSRHTTHPALVTLWGQDHKGVAQEISSITDIVPALLKRF